nr:hypothetical protein [Sphingomonas bacterium]
MARFFVRARVPIGKMPHSIERGIQHVSIARALRCADPSIDEDQAFA